MNKCLLWALHKVSRALELKSLLGVGGKASARVMKFPWETSLHMAARYLRDLPSPLPLLPLKHSPSFSRSSSLALSQPAPSKLLPRVFHGHFVGVSFLIRSDSQPFCASVFLWLFATVLVGRRWLQAMTCDFQGRGEQGNFKQCGLPLGAVPFRALVSIMAFRGTSPLCLFTLGKPSMPPPGHKPSKFPLLAIAQRSFSLDLGTSHCPFLNQPTASGPKLQETGCLMNRLSLSGSSGCSGVPGVLQLGLELRDTQTVVSPRCNSHRCTVL